MRNGSHVPTFLLVVCRAAREDGMAGKGNKSNQRKKLVKKLAKKVIKKAKKEENTEVDRSDVKPPSPFYT
jgi:hypothetical protein